MEEVSYFFLYFLHFFNLIFQFPYILLFVCKLPLVFSSSFALVPVCFLLAPPLFLLIFLLLS